MLAGGPFSGDSSAQTPRSHTAGFDLDTTAYSLRMMGPDRHATAGSIATIANVNDGGAGTYPFVLPDLADSDTTLGFGDCPAAVAITASDTPADALAASGAYGALNGVQKADGSGAENVSTDGGSILLTGASRTASQPLNSTTEAALQDIRDECGGIPAAVIFGGTSAVSEAAEATLDALVGTVYRFAGLDRFDTAGQVAAAVNAATGLPSVPYWAEATEAPSDTLTNTVFLAEGRTGADALAIGSYAAENHVPVLLTDSATLPSKTRDALVALNPDNIVVLGGPAAISQAVADAASDAASDAAVTRVQGADRFASSVEIATHLFGLWPELAGTEEAPTGRYSNLPVGLARSEGAQAGHVGWPDALASSWFLAKVNDGGAPTNANPVRFVPPIEAGEVATTIGGLTSATPPLLLTAQGGLPASVNAFLSGLYPSADNIITGNNPNPAGTDDDMGGFAYVFGGPAAVSAAAELAAATALSGGTYTGAARSDLAPTQANGSVFFTDLSLVGYTLADNLSGGFSTNGDNAAGPKVCALRGAYTGSVWQTVREQDGEFVDFSLSSYVLDGGSWPVGQSHAQCTARGPVGDAEDDTTAVVHGTSLSGHETATKTVSFGTATQLLTSTGAPGADPSPNSSTADPPACDVFTNIVAATGSCSNTFTYTGDLPVTHKNVTLNDATFELSVTIVRIENPAAGDQVDAIASVGQLVIKDGATTVNTLALSGEVAAVGSAPVPAMPIAGMYTASGGALGGFRFTVSDAGALTDVAVSGNA